MPCRTDRRTLWIDQIRQPDNTDRMAPCSTRYLQPQTTTLDRRREIHTNNDIHDLRACAAAHECVRQSRGGRRARNSLVRPHGVREQRKETAVNHRMNVLGGTCFHKVNNTVQNDI